MKRRIKIISISLAAMLLAAFSFTVTHAETIYELYGYSYTITDNDSISLCGWDNSTPELSVPDSILNRYFTSVATRGLQNNTGITTLDFSNAKHLTKIGYYSFNGCSGISNDLVIPETVTEIRESAFQSCSSLPSVTINADISVIKQQCFYLCRSLKTAVLPENLVEIEPFAFAGCTALEYVEIPETVTAIDDTAFMNDENLTLGVYLDSYAYQYAKDMNIPYVLLDEVKLGDANGDDNINIHDVTAIQRHVAEFKALDDLQAKAADVNGDGSITIEDATILQQYLAEYAIDYPVEELAS